MVVDCLTKLSLANGDPTLERTWEEDVLPRMRRILEVQEFSRLVRTSFPAAEIPDQELQRALDFVHGFLQTDPTKRTSAAHAKGHSFIGGGKCKSNKMAKDPIWNEESQDASADPSGSPLEGGATEVPVPDNALRQEDTPEQVRVTACSIPEDTCGDGCNRFEKATEEVKPGEQMPGDGAHISSEYRALLVPVLNRIFARAIEEIKNMNSKPREPASFDEKPINVSSKDSRVVPEPNSKPQDTVSIKVCQKPQEAVVTPKVQPSNNQGTDSSAEFEEPSYFNLKSLSLDSKFNSSKEEPPKQEKVRFKGLRRVFSRLRNFVSKNNSPRKNK